MTWLGDMLAVAVGVWLAGALLAGTLVAGWSLRRYRRRARPGQHLEDLLKRRGVI